MKKVNLCSMGSWKTRLSFFVHEAGYSFYDKDVFKKVRQSLILYKIFYLRMIFDNHIDLCCMNRRFSLIRTHVW